MMQPKKINNCQGNWRWKDDLLPHPDPDPDGDQPEPLPGDGPPPCEAQPADQGCQGIKEVKVTSYPKHVIHLKDLGMLNFIIMKSFLNCLLYKILRVFLRTFIFYFCQLKNVHLYIFAIH